jgi:hypothetical protein
MRASMMVAGMAMAVLLLASNGVAAEEQPAEKKNPWAGSVVAYEHTFSAISLDKGAEQSWNPYYAHSLSLQPTWRFHDYFALKARLDVEQELTDADETAKAFQWMWTDLQLDANAGKGYTEPTTGLRINGGLRVVLPVSLMSRARSMVLGLGPSAVLSRKFPVLKGLNVAYMGRWTYQFHESTTAQYDGSTIPSCNDPESPGCARFYNTGVRNAEDVLMHGPQLSLDITDKLSFASAFVFVRSGLYDVEPTTIQTGMGPVSIGENAADPDVGARYAQWFTAEVSYQAIDFVGVSLGVSSLYPQLASDGTDRTPFINRFTNVFLDLSLDIDSLVNRF